MYNKRFLLCKNGESSIYENLGGCQMELKKLLLILTGERITMSMEMTPLT